MESKPDFKEFGKTLATIAIIIYLCSLQLLVAEKQTQENAFKKYDLKSDSINRAYRVNKNTLYTKFQNTHDSIIRSTGTDEEKSIALDNLFKQFRTGTDSLNQDHARLLATEYQKLKSVFIDNCKNDTTKSSR